MSNKMAAAVAAPIKTRIHKETSKRDLLYLVKILLILVILLLLPKLVQTRRGKRNYRTQKQRRRAEVLLKDTRMICEMKICIHFRPEEAMNCVNICISPACYQEVYGDMPLEDGEIDVDRAKKFEVCVQDELRQVRKRQRTEPTMFNENVEVE